MGQGDSCTPGDFSGTFPFALSSGMTVFSLYKDNLPSFYLLSQGKPGICRACRRKDCYRDLDPDFQGIEKAPGGGTIQDNQPEIRAGPEKTRKIMENRVAYPGIGASHPSADRDDVPECNPLIGQA